MKYTILLIFAMLLTHPSAARLGETPAQCAQRYGEPLAQRESPEGHGTEYLYERGNYRVIIRYVPSTKTEFQTVEAGYISFATKDESEFDDETVEKILQRNLADQVLYAQLSRDIFWDELRRPADRNVLREWERKYRRDEFERGRRVERVESAGARANLSRDNVLTITSHFPLPPGYRNREERRKAMDPNLQTD